MRIDNRHCFKILRYIFSLVCFSAAFGMTLFWCHRFWKDEDLCLVDYLPYEVAEDVPLLMISVCFPNLLINSSLMAYNTTSKEYYKFIQGKEYYEGMENIPFDDVTINPTHFYVGDRLSWKNGTAKTGLYSDHVNEIPSVTFAGSYYGYPMKCYGFTLPGKNVKFGVFALNTTVLSNWGDIEPDICFKQIGIGFHLPGQSILSLHHITKVCVQN